MPLTTEDGKSFQFAMQKRDAEKPIVATDNLIWILFEAVKNYE